MAAQTYYYFDTSSILDMNAYGLIKRLRKVNAVVVPEVLDEVLDRNLKHRLERIAKDSGPRRRAAFLPGLNALDFGEHAIVRAMMCDRRLGHRCIYVSNDAPSLDFVGANVGRICETTMDTSDFLLKLYADASVGTDDIRRILACNTRRPNRKCRRRLEDALGQGSQPTAGAD